MVTCCICSCCVTTRNNPNNYTFHRFPSNPALREKWIRFVNRPDWKPTKHSTICSKHFDCKYFIQRQHRRLLLRESIPTLFLPNMTDIKKPYKCNKCTRAYTNSASLDYHKTSMHGINRKAPPLVEELKGTRGNNLKFATEIFDRYQCPVCKTIFPSRFVANKHIEVYHKKLFFSTPGSICPVKLEDCPNCKEKNKNLALHKCINNSTNKKKKKVHIFCFLCSKVFNSTKQFNFHVEIHHKNVETMFFPNMSYFTFWKAHIEKLAHIKYRLSSEENGRQFYNCSNTKITDMFSERCPSIIVVQSYTNGVLARLYIDHARHKVSEYNISKEFRKYCITAFLPSRDTSDGYDPCVDFKILMKNILEATAKIKISKLKQLVEKALEMTVILNTFNEDNDDLLQMNLQSTESSTDSEITRAVETTITIKTENSDVDMPDPLHTEDHPTVAPKIVNSYSLASFPDKEQSDTDSSDESDIDNKILISNLVGTRMPKSHDTNNVRLDASKDKEFSSFNDTYRDFIKKTECLRKPKVTRSNSSESIKHKSSKKTINSCSSDLLHDNITKTTKRSTDNFRENAVASVNHKDCDNSTNKIPDRNRLPTNIHSALTPVVITPSASPISNNKVCVAVPHAPVNTLIPTITTTTFLNVVGVSMPQHITITQPTADNLPCHDSNKSSFIKEKLPIKQEAKEINIPNTKVELSTEETANIKENVNGDTGGNIDLNSSSAENDMEDSVDKSSMETSETDNYEPRCKKKPNVKLERRYNMKTLKKIDYEYKVIEQDSDCNILVLKL